MIGNMLTLNISFSTYMRELALNHTIHATCQKCVSTNFVFAINDLFTQYCFSENKFVV